jgi:zinc protease
MTSRLPQPEILPPRDWSFPTPSRARLSNGIDTVVFDLPGQHVIAAHLILDCPLSAEDRALEGVATICARTLDEGTATHRGEEFAELLETEGAGFGIDVSLSGLQAVLDVPSSRLESAFALFAEAVREPALSAEDVSRHVQLRLAEIEQAQANSAQTAAIAFRRAVFADDRRAARMSGGEPETVAAVTTEAVRTFHSKHFGPQGTTLVLAGEFASDPLALAERYLGGWETEAQKPVAHEPARSGPRTAVLVDRPGAVQADLRLGSFAPDRKDPRWADLTVAGYAMGGAFLSRLNAVLREEKGYTYGVRLNFSPLRSGGSYAVQGSFRTEVLVDAVREARRLLDVSAEPFASAEVDAAISFFTGLSPLRYATADGVADQAATQALADLGDDYVDKSLADLRGVTPDSATDAYRSVVDLDDLSLVVVGNAETLADGLRDSGFDDLQILKPADLARLGVADQE